MLFYVESKLYPVMSVFILGVRVLHGDKYTVSILTLVWSHIGEDHGTGV